MNKPVWSNVLALSAWTLMKAHIVSCQEACVQITDVCMQECDVPHCYKLITIVNYYLESCLICIVH